MLDANARNRFADLLSQVGLEDKDLDNLAASLVWRVGRLSDEAPVTVRIGLASSIKLFNDLPKLRNASEAEVETAIKEDNIRVEWVGRMPG
jgi:hypothetical protein